MTLITDKELAAFQAEARAGGDKSSRQIALIIVRLREAESLLHDHRNDGIPTTTFDERVDAYFAAVRKP